MPWPALLPLIGAGITAASQWIGSKYQADTGRQSAEDAMRFQERLSNTAVQRHTADLRAAGYNPILAAGGPGASTPSGATFSPQGFAEIGSSGVNSAASIGSVVSQLSVLKSQIASLDQGTAKGSAETVSIVEGLKNLAASRSLIEAQTRMQALSASLADIDLRVMRQRFESTGGDRTLGKLWRTLQEIKDMVNPFAHSAFSGGQ